MEPLMIVIATITAIAAISFMVLHTRFVKLAKYSEKIIRVTSEHELNRNQLKPANLSKSNSVCSQGDPLEGKHYISPIKIAYHISYDDLEKKIYSALKLAIADTKGRIGVNDKNVLAENRFYLHFTVYQGLYGFVDDVELLLNFSEDGQTSTIDLRSASRVGYMDLGVNAKRMNRFKSNLSNLL